MIENLFPSQFSSRQYGVGIAATLLITAVCALPAMLHAQVRPAYFEGGIEHDGMLNEEAWRNAEPVTDFTQRELVSGAPPSERTEVRFLYDEAYLYIGVICYDSEPDGIVHKELQRDATLYQVEDNFTIVFDTYHDKRRGYYFAVNPNGAMFDATFRSYDTPTTEWDGIWEVRSRVGDFGWSTEIVIPFKTFRFPNTDTQVWGVNFRRQIRRKNEEIMWRGWGRDDDILHLSKAGTMTFERTLERSRQFDIKPYTVGGVEKVYGEDIDDTFKYGADVKYGITSNTTLDLTFNPDFAQIENDREVINLTRYDISYPEKRDFFLASSELFAFSQGMTNLFYSRRIGLSKDRRNIPIIGGAKLAQKTGSYTLGAMTMQTEEKYGSPSTNYSVVRMKKDLFEQSYIGFIVTSLADADGHDNQVYGSDFIFTTDSFLGDKNFEIQSYLTGSVTDGESRDNMAGRIFFSYPNDEINAFILYHALGPGFNPEMGFIRGKNPGVHQYMTRIEYTPRTDMPYLKKWSFQPLTWNYYTDMDRKLVARNVTIRPFGFITNADDTFAFSVNNEYDYITHSYSMFNNVTMERGAYEWWFYEVSAQSSTSRMLSVVARSQFGDYYHGDRTMYDVACTFKNSSHYSLTADVTYNDITLGRHSFETRELGGRLDLDFNTRLSSSTFVQWNNETNEVNVNFRIHYIPRIGSDIYLVYNHLMDEEDDFRTMQNAGMLKLDYTYQF